MRRSRGGVPGTPTTTDSTQNFNINNHHLNNNVHPNASFFNQTPSPIHANEMKIRTLLKDLQSFVKKTQEARNSSQPNLVNITKAHEKIKKEDKLSTLSKKKLRSLYAISLKDSEEEIKNLRQALDCINQIRLTQNEIRILQTQQLNMASTSPNTSMTHLTHHSHHHGNNNHHAHRDYHTDAAADSKQIVVNRKTPTVTMRRGVLMSILQQAALTLPLWIGDIGQSPPPLCGNIPPESSYICKPGDKVAAIVKNAAGVGGGESSRTMDGGEEEEENWILAEVVAYHANTNKYDVDDVDAEEDQVRYTLNRKRIVPLPLWRANPLTDPEAIFPKDSFVLALYPQTTCFYRGIVSESPQTPLEDYLILFEDNTYPEGYSPPLNVPQLYVVACKDKK